MEIKSVHIGLWFQRTTLHLTEMWLALHEKRSEIDLDQDKLRKLVENLKIDKSSREAGYLEYILVNTPILTYKIYEDGLMVIEKRVSNIQEDLEILKRYYDEQLAPFISYLFSKGAPIPKELANIKTILPYIIVTKGSEQEVKTVLKELKEDAYGELEHENIGVYRSPNIIVINNIENTDFTQAIIESQIFFREFKTQLQRYLSIHRIIWEKIAVIKEQATIGAAKISELRNQLTNYQKTITLIGTRIKQMDAYLETRSKMVKILQLDEYLNSLFAYKYETLANTHTYIQHLWDMTENYLNSAIQVFVELAEKSNKDAFNALRLVTSIGAIAGIFGYLAKEDLPKLTSQGLIYFGILAVLTWLLNEIISRFYMRKNYKIVSEEEKKRTEI